jgi:hypothetical protein
MESQESKMRISIFHGMEPNLAFVPIKEDMCPCICGLVVKVEALVDEKPSFDEKLIMEALK